jgi:hypothetical protein
MSKKKDVFGVITKKFNHSKKKDENLALIATRPSNRSKKEIFKLLVELGKHIQNGGQVQEFCFKVGISTRQMREYRAQYRTNPKAFQKN